MSVSSSTSVTTASSSSSSSSQYLTPEFFPPAMLDAKNSPLALLVQTCSSIGRDPQVAKSSNGEKKDSSSSASASHNGTSTTKEPSSRLKSNSPPEKSSKTNPDDRRKSSHVFHNGTDHTNKREINTSNKSSNSTTKSSPNKSCFKAPSSSTERSGGLHDKYSNGLFSNYNLDRFAHTAVNDENNILGPSSTNSRLLSSYSNGITGKLNGGYSYMDSNSDYMAKNPFYPLYNSMKLQEAAALQNAVSFSSSNASLGSLYSPFLGYPLPLDPLAAAAVAYSANLAAVAQVAAAASQRKSSPIGGTHASGILRRCSGSCKDPFCLGQHHSSNTTPALASQSPSLQQCKNAGCNQCSEKSTPHLSNSSSINPTSSSISPATSGLFYPGCPSVPGSSFCLPPFSPLMVQGSLASPLLNSSLSCGPSQPQSFVCNWVQNGEYCGKRFSTSEELLLHLHGHTTVPTSQPHTNPIDLVHQKQPLQPPLAHFNPSALPPLPFPLPNYFGSNGSRTLNASRSSPMSSYALPLMPSHQRNSISPNSLLSSARYHPYKSPSLSVTPPGLGSPQQQSLLPSSFQSLAAYYSPYAIYNQRLNAAAAVGP